MGRPHGAGGTLLVLTIMFLLAALLTVAAFFTFVPPWRRGTALYMMMGVLCGAELVFFAYLAGWRLARRTGRGLSTPGRVQVYGLLVLWFLITLVLAVLTGRAGPERSVTTDRILFGQAAATFLFFAFAYAVLQHDLRSDAEQREVDARRRRLRLQGVELDPMMDVLRQAAEAYPQEILAVERLARRLEATRSALESALSREPADEGQHARLTAVEGQIAQCVAELRALAVSRPLPGKGELPDWLTNAEHLIERLQSALEARERLLSV